MSSEPTRVDVVVAGGGAAGIAAAVGASRAGANVRLLERYPFLGGAATISSVLTFCGFFDQSRHQVTAGVGEDVLKRLRQRGVYRELAGTSMTRDGSALAEQTIEVTDTTGPNLDWTGNHFILLDLETTKLVYDEVVTEAGVDVRLHSTVIGARREEGRVAEVVVNSRGGNETVVADSFVDATGDGALLAAAGAAVRVAPVGERQTSTLVCRFSGLRPDADLSSDGVSAALDEHTARTGVTFPRRGGIMVRLPITGQIFALLVDEQTDALDAGNLTDDEMSGRRQAWHYLSAFREHLNGWHEAYLVETGPQLGLRETRHLRGREELVRQDVVSARKRPGESIGRCGWPIEDHAGPGITRYGVIAGGGHYDIPYGVITSANTDNLWAAGRLTAADHDAYASVRVMGTAFATGHAAGVAAALSARGIHHDVAAIRAELTRQGALL